MPIVHFYTLPLEIIGKFWFSYILGGTEKEYRLKIG